MKNSGPHSWSIKLWSQGVCSRICNLIKHPDASHVDLKALCLAEVSMYYIQSPRMLSISVNVQPRKSAPALNFTSHILISWTNFKICFYILRKLATINSFSRLHWTHILYIYCTLKSWVSSLFWKSSFPRMCLSVLWGNCQRKIAPDGVKQTRKTLRLLQSGRLNSIRNATEAAEDF